MISQHEALLYTMVLVSAADNRMTDQELSAIGDIVDHLPLFQGFDWDRMGGIANDCVSMLQGDDGLDKAIALIKSSLEGRLRESAYALACEVAAADGEIVEEEMRLLEMLRPELAIDRLVAAGIERGTAARYRQVPIYDS